MENKYYTVLEIAERFKVNPRTVLQWISKDILNATRIGDVIRASEDDINEMIKANQTKKWRQ